MAPNAPDTIVPAGTSPVSHVPAKCEKLQEYVRCPGFLLPWSGSRSLPTGGGSHSNGATSAQRLKEARYLAWNARLTWVVIHGAFIGGLFIFDTRLSKAVSQGDYWYTGCYGILFLLTIVQYCVTSGSSPGYVQEIQDVMEADLEEGETSSNMATSLERSGSVSAISGLAASPANEEHPSQAPAADSRSETEPLLPKSESWKKRAEEWFKWHNQREIARTSSTLLRRTDSNRRCPYCRVWQPMRTKHCHDCDKCVLRFDHHCFWVGTCIGQRNHPKFWWYLLLESALACWTAVISLSAFSWERRVDLWLLHNFLAFCMVFTLFVLTAFLLVLLGFHTYLVLTNQTTYETTRRKRISYLRHVPDNVHPFSQGFWRNIYFFCCTPSNVYPNYELPSMSELERRAEEQTWWQSEYCRCF